MIETERTLLLNEIRKLPQWKLRADDNEWLNELLAEYPLLSVSTIRACRDWHTTRHPNKKHIWKTALRNWLAKQVEFSKERPVLAGRRCNGIATEAEIGEKMKALGYIK